MKKQTLAALGLSFVLAFAFSARTSWADNARTKTGAPLTYLLNGSPVYLGTINAWDGGAGFVDNISATTAFSISQSAFICAVQCDNDGLVYNHRSDGGTLTTRSLVVATSEKAVLGILQPGLPWVSVRAIDAGTINCNVYECK